MYGDQQEYLRVQAGQFFDGAFQSEFGSVYVAALTDGDLTYPEVAAADHLAGYVRAAVDDERSYPSTLPDPVRWFSSDWREPTGVPIPYYRLRGISGRMQSDGENRVVAWIEGRHPDGEQYDISSRWDSFLDRLDSEQVQEYLRSQVVP